MMRWRDSDCPTVSTPETRAEPAAPTPARRRLRLVLITFAVVVSAFALLFMLTENVGIAPFVYAIL